MKKHRSDVIVQLHRERSRIGVAVKPGGIEVIKSKTGKAHISETEEKTAEKRRKAIPYRKIRRIACGVIAAELVILAGYFSWKSMPVAIAISDEDACYLKNEKEAEKTMDLLVKENLPEGTDLYTKTINHNMTVHRTLGFGKDFKTAEEAEQLIWKDYVETDKTSVSTQSTQEQTWDYIPEPEYIKDDTMVAGDARYEDEGEPGTQKVTMLYLVRNGELEEDKIIDSKITDEGRKAVIYKGTLGLPEGADWRTYTGMPVFNDGGELISDAQNYLGLRYVWGGYSLKSGVDCVGFVVAMYKKFGITLPRSHEGLRRSGVKVDSIADAQPGDIICYNGHVALYMGDGKVIHATRGKSNNVHISKVNYNKKRHIITIRRIVN